MKANDLCKNYPMQEHVEHGRFFSINPAPEKDTRPASGCIYYYYYPSSSSEFHSIDCDEYWVFNAGASLDLWLISREGALTVKRLGLNPGEDPAFCVKAGTVFAGRHPFKSEDGTFMTMITVPRYTDDGFKHYKKEDVLELCPAAVDFWKEIEEA